MEGYETPQPLSFNPERARELLSEAGYPGGEGFPVRSILINTSEAHKQIAAAIQNMWQTELGIDVEIENKEWKVYLDAQSNLDYDMSRSGWIGDFMDPITFLSMWTTGNGNNDTGWSNLEFDRLIRAAQESTSPEEHFALLREAEEILLEELPMAPIYWYTRIYMLDPRVGGWEPKLLDNRPYKYLYFREPGA
jgi:oligopeptide transport system substrate-binding protein